MNTDQMKGAIKQGVGKVQEKAGKVTGSTEHRAEGVSKQVEGKVQKNFGDAKENVKRTIDKL